jgi:hypothetical protein
MKRLKWGESGGRLCKESVEKSVARREQKLEKPSAVDRRALGDSVSVGTIGYWFHFNTQKDGC